MPANGRRDLIRRLKVKDATSATDGLNVGQLIILLGQLTIRWLLVAFCFFCTFQFFFSFFFILSLCYLYLLCSSLSFSVLCFLISFCVSVILPFSFIFSKYFACLIFTLLSHIVFVSHFFNVLFFLY
jgi:hypothetical protein